MCGFANPLSFKNVTDAEISIVETFIRTKTMDFLRQRMCDSINEQCDVLVADEELIDHFGELYANNQGSFMFHAGDIILIKELVDHVQRIVDGNGKNTGLVFFQNTEPIRKRAPLRTQVSGNKKQKLPGKSLVKPIEEENLKAELIRKVTICFKPYMSEVHANNETINMNECVVVLKPEDGSKIYGDISCIICNVENRKNQKPKRVYYNTKGKSKGCWVLSNIMKHLQLKHNLSAQVDENNKLDLPNVTNDADNSTVPNLVDSHEEHYIVETDSNDNLSLVLVDDSELKKIENSDRDSPELLYSQLSVQINNVLATFLKNDEPHEEMEYFLTVSPRKLTVALIPGDGSCIFAAISHQLWMHKINSKEHKQATKKLRADVVEHILKPENFPLYQQRLHDRVYKIHEKSGKKITDMEKECKFFVRHILSNHKTWGGAETLLAVSILYSTNVFVFYEKGECSKIKKADHNNSRSIAIAFRIGLNEEGDETFNHYDSVCEISSADLYAVASRCCKHGQLNE